MIRERVQAGERGYDILIGPGLLQQTGSVLKELGVSSSSRHLLVTDQHVRDAGHLAVVQTSLGEAGYQVEVLLIRPGEGSKTLALAEEAFALAYEAGLDRRSVVVALGGGVVGDLAGFVAAAYMRGIDFVQVPTTLLAHDSAVGGKVAVNLPQAKNIVGAFHQPLAVIYDTEALKTLPPREMRSGLAEAIKHGVIRDAGLFAWIDEQTDSILLGDDQVLTELLARSCRIKADVVSEDEREAGVRGILNFGHTLGHAVEGLSPYGAFAHGEAVAIGMVAAARLSERLGLCTARDASAVKDVIEKVGLPTLIPATLSEDDLIASMRKDKKSAGGILTFVLMKGIGDVEIVRDVPEDLVRDVIEAGRA